MASDIYLVQTKVSDFLSFVCFITESITLPVFLLPSFKNYFKLLHIFFKVLEHGREQQNTKFSKKCVLNKST